MKDVNDCYANNNNSNTLDSSDEQQTVHKQESPNHVQVRRVTQVFEEQDKLFVDSRQKQKKSMKKAVTISAVDGSDGISPLVDADSTTPSFFTFPPVEPSDVVNGKKEKPVFADSAFLDSAAGKQPVLIGAVESKRNVVAKNSDVKTSKRVERVKRASRRQRKRKDRENELDDCDVDDETSVEPSCGGSLQTNCSLL